MSIIAYLIEHNRYCNLIGIILILFGAWLLSFRRSQVTFRPIIIGLFLQYAIGFTVLKTVIGNRCIAAVAYGFDILYQCAHSGSQFVFGSLADSTGPWGFIFAIKILPIIVFFGAFTALLFHLRVIQCGVSAVNYVLRPLMGTSGAETLCAIANSFLGQTEAPLVIRHYLKHMTSSELFAVMVGGMATISSAILVVFVAMGVSATHLLASSVMCIPGSLVIAKLMYPETEKSVHDSGQDGQAQATIEHCYNGICDALSHGTIDGLQVALNIGAMLIVFLSLLTVVNACLGTVSACIVQDCRVSIEKIMGLICAPFGFLLGFTGKHALQAGELIGTKIAVNELIAYTRLVNMQVPDRMMAIMTYALCGFSNISCIGIQVAGIGALIPERRPLIAHLGIYAVIAGTLTNVLSAMMAALLL